MFEFINFEILGRGLPLGKVISSWLFKIKKLDNSKLF